MVHVKRSRAQLSPAAEQLTGTCCCSMQGHGRGMAARTDACQLNAALQCVRHAATTHSGGHPLQPPAAAEVAAAGAHLQQLAPFLAHSHSGLGRQAAAQGHQGQQSATEHTERACRGSCEGCRPLDWDLRSMLGGGAMRIGAGVPQPGSSWGAAHALGRSGCSSPARCIVKVECRTTHEVNEHGAGAGFQAHC